MAERTGNVASKVGYEAIKRELGIDQSPTALVRGASSTPTLMFDDLPPRFAQHVKALREAMGIHVTLTERQEAASMQAVRMAREAMDIATAALAAAQDADGRLQAAYETCARTEAALEGHKVRANTAVRHLSRWWTAIAIGLVLNAMITFACAAIEIGHVLAMMQD